MHFVLDAVPAFAQRLDQAAAFAQQRIVEEGLVAGLDTDTGGKLAEDLMALYSYVTRRLTHANLHNDDAALDECVRLLEPVRAAWIAIDPDASVAPKAQ